MVTCSTALISFYHFSFLPAPSFSGRLSKNHLLLASAFLEEGAIVDYAQRYVFLCLFQDLSDDADFNVKVGDVKNQLYCTLL